MRFRYPFYVILGASGVQMRLKNHYNNFVYFLQNSTANYFRKFFLQEKILQQTILQKKTMISALVRAKLAQMGSKWNGNACEPTSRG